MGKIRQATQFSPALTLAGIAWRGLAVNLNQSTKDWEKLAAERMKQSDDMLKEAAHRTVVQPCDMPEPGPQFKPIRFAGQQTCGRLVKVECGDAGILFFVSAGGRTLVLHAEELGRVKFVTYTRQVKGKIECGTEIIAQPVLVTYRPPQIDRSPIDGELTAVEFVPEEWLQ